LAEVAARQLTARDAGEQPNTAGSVQDAGNPTRATQCPHQFFAKQPEAPRWFAAAIDNLDRGPASMFRRSIWLVEWQGHDGFDRRRRRNKHAGNIGSPSTFNRYLSRMPGWCSFLPVCLVVLIEHNNRADVANRAQNRGAGAHYHRAGCGPCPVLGQQGNVETDAA
jgi:hypothetical protein